MTSDRLECNPARDELLLGGMSRGAGGGGQPRTWVIAVDRDGLQHWEYARHPSDDGDLSPSIVQLLPSPQGGFIGRGSTSQNLAFVAVGPDCR